MIEVRQLSKRYGPKVAIEGVSFHVGAGEVVGFLGPNGAGKSTTLQIIAGVLGATSGTVTVMGHDIEAQPLEARRALGFMPETVPLYPEMRVAEYLGFRAELKGISRSRRASHVASALERAGVIDSANRTIGHLSKGYRQRVGIADAIVANPPVLVFDEPTAGLDPNQIRDTRALLAELGRDHAVLVSTHILSEAEAICGRIVVIDAGRIVASGTQREIEQLAKVKTLEVVVRGDLSLSLSVAKEALGASAGAVLTSQASDGQVHRLTFSLGTRLPSMPEPNEALVAALVGAGLMVREVRGGEGSLEQVFAELTKPRTSESVAESASGRAG